MKNQLIAVEAKDLQVIEYRGQRVVTTEQLAAGYGTDVNNITVNFHRNQGRFVEGKHYFDVQGEELREMKNWVSLSNAVGKRARSLRLWTERGAANHAKMLETDQAWKYHDDLTEFYFTRRDILVSHQDLLNDAGTLRSLLLNYTEDVQQLKVENKELETTVDSLQKHFAKGMTLPAFGKALNGVNISKLNWWAFDRDWLYNEQRDPEKDPRWRVASYARDRYLTEEEIKVKPHGKDEFTKITPVLLEKGCHRIYQLYIKGQLPMKKTWNGEYSHDKAVYTPEK